MKEIVPNAGDSVNIPNFAAGTPASLLAVSGGAVASGIIRIRSPLIHDQAQGLRLVRGAGPQVVFAPPDAPQPLFAQDHLIIETSAGATAKSVVAWWIYLSNMPGAAANLRTAQEVEAATVNVTGLLCTLAGVAAAGTYSGEQAINVTQNTLRANTNYALMGATFSETIDVAMVNGPDTGHYNVGIPGLAENIWTRRWFMDLSLLTGLPLVPVINSANAGATMIKAASVEAHAAPNISLILAQLSN
jgi:hypothetical protein